MDIKQNFSKYKWLIFTMLVVAVILAAIGAPTLVAVCVAVAGVVPVLVPDRRMIFLLIAVFVVLPLIYPMFLETDVTPEVRSMYDAVEELESGSVVLMSFDFDPATRPELYPATLAFMRHCVERGHRIITMALWPLGVSLAEEAVRDVIIDDWNVENPDQAYEYGQDYVHLPYMPGGIVVINQLITSFDENFPRDIRNTPIEDIPAMRGVSNLLDVDFVFALSSGDPGLRDWIMGAADRADREVAGAATAVSAPEFYPYIHAGQLVGLMGGLKGASEYEKLIDVLGTATAGMDAQSLAHLAIIVFIIVGNATFFMDRRKNRV